MSKKIAMIFFMSAVIFTAVNMALGWYSQRVTFAPPGRVIKLSPNEITAMVIYQGGNVVAEFRRTNSGNWQFRAPTALIDKATADRAAIEELLNFAVRAEENSLDVTPAEVGLENDNLMQVVYYAGNENSSIFLGDFSSDGQQRFFAVDTARDNVLAAPSALMRIFTRAPEQFRSRDLFALRGRGPDNILLTTKDKKFNLRRTNNEGWVILEPFNWLADNDVIGSLLQALWALRAENILPLATIEKMPPTLTISLTNDTNTQTVDFFSAPNNNEIAYARVLGREEIYEIPSVVMRELSHPQLSDILRRRSLNLLNGQRVDEIKITNAELQTIALKKDNNNWQANGAQSFIAEEKAVQTLISLFNEMPLTRIVAENNHEQPIADWQFIVGLYDISGALLSEIKVKTATDKNPDRDAMTSPIFLAQLNDRPQILELHPLGGLTLTQPFIAYRSRQVQNIGFEIIKQITLEQFAPAKIITYERIGDAVFKQIAPPEKSLSETANWELLSLARQLAQLRCEGYLDEKKSGFMTYGLDRPLLKIMLMLQFADQTAPNTLTLTIGQKLTLGTAENPQHFYSAIFSDRELIFVIEEKLVKRILAMIN